METTKKYAQSLMLAMIMFATIAAMPAAAYGADFDGHWAAASIKQLIDAGAVDEGAVRPDDKVTRAEIAEILVRAFKIEARSDKSFTDVRPDDAFEPYISKAVGAGLLSGYPEGTMKPGNPITRQEVTAVLTRYSKLAEDADRANRFTDTAAIGEWAKGAVGAAVKAGIVNGYVDGSFRPQGSMTRAEAMTVVARLLTSSPVAVDMVEVKEGETLGNETTATTVNNVRVLGSGARLVNLVIEGNLEIAETVGGDVTLEGVIVKGKTIVKSAR